jgi:hypothetical protein
MIEGGQDRGKIGRLGTRQIVHRLLRRGVTLTILVDGGKSGQRFIERGRKTGPCGTGGDHQNRGRDRSMKTVSQPNPPLSSTQLAQTRQQLVGTQAALAD